MTSWRAGLVERVARLMCDAWEPRVLAEKEEAPAFDDSEPGVQIFWRKQAEIALDIAIPAILERAAISAACAFDDRPRSRAGHPSQMDWDDGYRDGTAAAATAIRSLKDNPDVEA